MTQTHTGPESLATRSARAFTAYRAGDGQGMDDLVDLLNPLLWNVARSQGLAPAAAEDAVQTAWLRLVESSGRIDEPQAVMGWLLVTVKRESWRIGRRTPVQPAAPGTAGVARELEDQAPGPELVAILSERQRRLWSHLQTLSLKCQELLRVIAYADKPDYAQVAEALDMPVGSIGPTRGRCLTKLRALLQGDPTWGGDR